MNRDLVPAPERRPGSRGPMPGTGGAPVRVADRRKSVTVTMTAATMEQLDALSDLGKSKGDIIARLVEDETKRRKAEGC